jgi:hypothetical protein
MWDKQPARAFHLCAEGRHLYLLTYTALYRLNPTSLAIEASYRIPYIRGTGMLSLAESPDCQRLAVYQMPGRVLLLDPESLTPASTISLSLSDYITRLRWGSGNHTLFALGDRGYLATVNVSSQPVVISTHKFTGHRPGSWDTDASRSKLYVTATSANAITRFDADGDEFIAPFSPDQATVETVLSPRPGGGLRLNRIAVDSIRSHIFVQQVGSFGVAPLRDGLFLLSENNGRVIKHWDVPGGLKGLEIGLSGRFLFYAENGSPATIKTINLETLETQTCARLECNDFAVTPHGALLYYARYIGDDAEIGLIKLHPPP